MTAVDLRRLAARLRGRLVLPSEPEFASVRKWFIGRMNESTPQAVVQCAESSDVVEAVAFARSAGLPFALRSGAHSFAEYSSTDGLLIDLGGLNTIDVSADARTVTTGPGVRIGPLADVLAEHGRVVPFGWCTMVAVAGAAMGGGFGPLGRYYGLACDHLVEAEIAVADGRILRVAEDTEPDLLWALRGAGGGSFGTVTSLTFRTRPSIPAVSFAAWWKPEDGAAVIDGWQRWAPSAPDAVNAELVLRCWPDVNDPPIVVVFGLMIDMSVAQAAARVAELADLIGSAPERTTFTEVPAARLPTHHTFAGEPVKHARLGGRPVDAEPGVRFVKSEFFDDPFPRDTAAELVEWLFRNRVDSQQRELEFIPWGGAIARRPSDGTAFVHRSPRFLLEHTVQAYGSTDLKRSSHEWVTGSKAIPRPFGNGHTYQNYPDPDIADWDVAYYGDNLHRLRRVKATYDPDDVFRFDQSIPLP